MKKFLKALFEKKEAPVDTTKPIQTNLSPDHHIDYNDADYKENYRCYDDWQCPYCQHQFEKQITRKRKCPSCQNTIIVRTHFYSKRKMLLKKEQLETYEKLASVYWEKKWIDDFFKKFNTTLEEERKKGTAGSKNPFDIAWGMLNRVAGEEVEKMQYGLYRNARMGMGDLLRKEGKLERALLFYLEVCYLDINGATNTGVNLSPELFKKYPPFQLEMALIAPGIVGYIEDLKKELNLDLDNLKVRFIEHNTRSYKNNNLVPLSPEKAWGSLEKELVESK